MFTNGKYLSGFLPIHAISLYNTTLQKHPLKLHMKNNDNYTSLIW